MSTAFPLHPTIKLSLNDERSISTMKNHLSVTGFLFLLLSLAMTASISHGACLPPARSVGTATLAQASQGTPAPLTTVTALPAARFKLSAAQETELNRLLAWQNELGRYYGLIGDFLNNFNQAVQLKNASGFGSLLTAKDQVETMQALLVRLQKMRPPDAMSSGHMKLVEAFDLMTKYLTLNPAPPDFAQKFQSNLTIGQAELMKWKTDYDRAEEKFIKSLGESR
jgi:hypothetical protein